MPLTNIVFGPFLNSKDYNMKCRSRAGHHLPNELKVIRCVTFTAHMVLNSNIWRKFWRNWRQRNTLPGRGYPFLLPSLKVYVPKSYPLILPFNLSHLPFIWFNAAKSWAWVVYTPIIRKRTKKATIQSKSFFIRDLL